MFHHVLLRLARIPAYRNTPAIDRINTFLTTPSYILLVCLLTLLSNVFSLEVIVYPLLCLLLAYIGLLGKDMLPAMPVIICCYMANSERNNPGRHPDTIYSNGLFVGILAVLLVIAVGCLTWRVLTDRILISRRKPRLLSGMLVLGGAYLVGGIFSSAYPDVGIKHILFALLQIAAVMLPYLLLCRGVDWYAASRDYFAWTGFGVGCMLLGQLLWIYLTQDVIVNGSIIRDRIVTGWGMYNNMGIMLAMMIPFAFYLASRYHRGWIGTVAGTVFMVGVFLSCSRNAILFGSLGYLLCIFKTLSFAKNPAATKKVLIVAGITAVSAVAVFHEQLLLLFTDILQREQGFFDPNSRDLMYFNGLKLFAKYPIFGSSFYPQVALWDWASIEEFSTLIPARWHSTLIQLLASTGIVGLAAYGYHTYQCVRLFAEDHSREKTFIACSLAVLVISSMIDCHFFNVGPVLFYSFGLAFAENCGKAQTHTAPPAFLKRPRAR